MTVSLLLDKKMHTWVGAGFCSFLGLSPRVVVSPGDGMDSM